MPQVDYDLEALQRHLRIEEDSRKREQIESQQTEFYSKANNVEEIQPSKSKN